MASSAPQPEGSNNTRAPLTAVSPTDQSGIIAILTSFSLSLVLLSTGVRVYAKRYAGVFRSDDLAFYAAVVFAVVQTAVVFFLMTRGWGKVVGLMSEDDLRSVQRVSYTGNLEMCRSAC